MVKQALEELIHQDVMSHLALCNAGCDQLKVWPLHPLDLKWTMVHALVEDPQWVLWLDLTPGPWGAPGAHWDPPQDAPGTPNISDSQTFFWLDQKEQHQRATPVHTPTPQHPKTLPEMFLSTYSSSLRLP